jgi:hypothetical protein
MASRRSGYESLVRRHQLQTLLSRNFDAASTSDGGQPNADFERVEDAPKGGVARQTHRAYGNEEISRIATAIEESVPWSSGILDVFWPKIEAEPGPMTAQDGTRLERPRPEK